MALTVNFSTYMMQFTSNPCVTAQVKSLIQKVSRLQVFPGRYSVAPIYPCSSLSSPREFLSEVPRTAKT